MKVIKNCCYGGFGLSDEAFEWLIKNKGWVVTGWNHEGNKINPEADIIKKSETMVIDSHYYLSKDEDSPELRTNPDLIECIEALGEKASGGCAKLVIVEVPDDVEFQIDEYDGWETIREIHRTW